MSWPPILLAREGDGHLLTSAKNLSASQGYNNLNPTGGSPQSYTYDPLGRRYAVCADTAANCAGTPGAFTVTIYLHDNYDREIAEYDRSGVLSQNNVFDAHDRAPVAEILTPAATVSGSYGVQFLHFDTRGTWFTITSGGREINSWWSAPDSGLTSLLLFPDYGYAGGRFDDNTQLYYLGHRYYAPYLGRFLSPDPSGLAAGINLYGYVGNDPINNVDPDGLAAEAVANWTANSLISSVSTINNAVNATLAPWANLAGSGVNAGLNACGAPCDPAVQISIGDLPGAAAFGALGMVAKAGQTVAAADRAASIAGQLEVLGGGAPRLVPTPKGASQFIFPNGAVMRFDIQPGQYLKGQDPHINLENFPGSANPNRHIDLKP